APLSHLGACLYVSSPLRVKEVCAGGEGLPPHGASPCTDSSPGFCMRMDERAVLTNGGSSEAARPSREFASYPLLRDPTTGACGTGSCPLRLGAPPARPRGGGVCGSAGSHGPGTGGVQTRHGASCAREGWRVAYRIRHGCARSGG